MVNNCASNALTNPPAGTNPVPFTEWDRLPYGLRQLTICTTLVYKCLGVCPILAPPVLSNLFDRLNWPSWSQEHISQIQLGQKHTKTGPTPATEHLFRFFN